jgi:type II secretory ATPase GspE/PulE/Tfp pilus assembly ATPase PilB-like protein
MGIEPFLLSSTLLGILTQRLVRNLCTKCKEEYAVSEAIRQKYLLDAKAKLYRIKGCNSCQHSGYKGRLALCEYLRVSPQIRSLISSSASEHAIKREARLLGMRTLREDGLLKIQNGITTIEEVLKVTGPDEPL